MLIKRENYLNKIRPFYDVDVIKVIIGPRRAGKSKIIELIIEELLGMGVTSENILYINFEMLEFEAIDDFKKLNDYINERRGQGKQYLFFDEIQHVKGFEKAVNSFRVSFDCSIFITGSNSKMLSTEISTLLTGRIVEFPIYPFSYKEAVEYRKLSGRDKADSFQDYLAYGGYPLRFDLPDESSIKRYLNELYLNICQKDIFARGVDVEQNKFNKVASYVLSNAGDDFNPGSICNYMKSNNGGKEYCSVVTLYSYLEKLEKAFLIKPIYRYNIPGKAALKSNPKYYAIDNGMRRVSTNSNAFDVGRYLENLVCIELLSRDYEVFVGKTYKGEVDFVAIKNGKKCFMQVSYIMESQETIEREFGAFSCIKDPSPKYVLSLDKIDMSRDGVTHLNIEDFCLGKVDLFLS
jgi:uncharacterized protein